MASQTMIEVTDLHKHYGEIHAVNGLSFAIKQGEIVGFLGPNGAGKTTTMKMLTCFLAPSSGEVKVAGHDIYTDSMGVRRAVGYLPEDTPLYRSMTVLDFLRFVAAIREVPASRQKERLRDVVDICGIKDRLGQIIGTLSKGYRQRVGLAQALVHDPPVLILDEPTSGLDPNQIVEIREVIKNLGKEKTLILSTHVLSEVEATCDRAIIIDRGSVVGDGSIDVLVKAREAQAGFVVSLETDKPLERILKTVKGIGSVQGVEPLPAGYGQSFVVTPKKDADPRLDLMKVCVEEGWIILQLTPKAASLEDVFRGLTLGGALASGDGRKTTGPRGSARRDDAKKSEPRKARPEKDEPEKDEPEKDEPGKSEPEKDEPEKDEPGKSEPEKNDNEGAAKESK